MARERNPEGDPEASLLNRRNFLRATGAAAASMGFGVVAQRPVAGADAVPVDARSVTVDHAWETVETAESYADPVVVASGLSYRGPQPASPRVRNVAASSFDLSVEEWTYLDGAHREETVGCLVTDAGRYDLGDGAALEVGRVRTDHRWTSTAFEASFGSAPVVFSTPQTVDGPQPVVTRHRGVSDAGLEVRLQEEEAQGPHRIEDVGYLAVEPGTGTLNGRSFEAGVRGDVGHEWQTVEFDTTYRRPVFVADLQTFRGANTCAVRYRNLTESSVEIRVEEERSADRETFHLTERVGYLVVEGEDPEPATGDTPLSELDRARVEQLVHEYVNERRAERGLDALDFDTDLREIARYHSEDMAENDYLAHTSPDGETMSDRYEMFGYDCRVDAGDGRYYTGSENVAYTYYDRDVATDDGTVRYTNADELARGLVRGWMNSDSHRENLLMEAWNNEGIGVAIRSDGKVFATQNFC